MSTNIISIFNNNHNPPPTKQTRPTQASRGIDPRSRNIKSTSCNISTKQDAFLCFAEIKKGRGSFLLLLFSMDIKAFHLNVSEKISMKLDRVT
jgi:hypothetical protein